MEIILACTQVATWLRCSERTIKKMVKQEQIPCVQCGKKSLFIVSELEDWFFREVEIEAPELLRNGAAGTMDCTRG